MNTLIVLVDLRVDLGPWEVLALIVLLFWIGLTLDRTRAWPRDCVLPSSRERSPAPGGHSRVTVIVPARNEASVIGQSLPALLEQGGSIERLVLVDDHSSDATAEVAREVARSLEAPEKLWIVAGRPRPPGWTGKLGALQTGIDVVQEREREEPERKESAGRERWFLFTDADILHPANSVERLLARAAEGGYDLVSIMVRLATESAWERFLIPPFVYFFQMMYPFRRVADPGSRVAAAAGGCILIRRESLEKIGGLASMHDAIIDDVTLARRVKGAGGRCWLGSEGEMVSLRGYSTLREIVDMVARTAFTELRYRYSLVVLTWIALGLFFVSPPFLLAGALVAGARPAAGLALIAWGLQSASLAPVVQHLRVARAWSVLLPFASAVYGAITTISAWRHFRGRGIVWRGRVHGR